MMNVRRSVIAGKLGLTAIRGWAKAEGKKRLVVELKGRGDHDWWAVPGVELVPAELVSTG